MKRVLTFLFTAIVVLVVSGRLHAETSIIVHPKNASDLDKRAIAKLFLGKYKSFPGGSKALPINIKEGADARESFDSSILGKNASQLKAYWSKQLFTGKGTPPKEVEDQEEIKKLVAENPSVIGYIDSDLVDDSVKVVLSFQ